MTAAAPLVISSLAADRSVIKRCLSEHGREVLLRPAQGLVCSIREFVHRHPDLLEEHEAAIIRRMLQILPGDVPVNLNRVLRRVRLSSALPRGSVRARRAGGRSAYLSAHRLHFKGCNPHPGIGFPFEQLDFGTRAVKHRCVPFGCLTAEGTMREILAYCFLRSHDIATMQLPVCVFEYRSSGEVIGYCLVSRRTSDRRTEERLDFLGLSVRDLIYIKDMEKRFRIKILEGDVGYTDYDAQWYAKEKATLLVALNINGAFRGILNSNLGNEMVLPSGRLALCDFDSFRVVKIPKRPSSRFIDAFCLWCAAEVVKASPIVWEYLHLEGSSRRSRSSVLASAYAAHSTLWRAYTRRLCRAAAKIGWSVAAVDRALRAALTTRTCHDMLLDVVPNSMVLKTSYSPAHSLYEGHR